MAAVYIFDALGFFLLSILVNVGLFWLCMVLFYQSRLIREIEGFRDGGLQV
jgi:hypothetical protein